jgi:small subunit ribosomal protein S15
MYTLTSMSQKPEKSQIIQDNRRHATDTGSCEVQVALISERVSQLTQHLKTHNKDFHSRRGLIALTTQRRKLLTYLKRTDLNRYNALIQKLNLKR